MLKKLKLKKLTPSQILLKSFVIIIAIGTLLLMLPFSARSGQKINLMTALFTATSAVSVTGLSVVDVNLTFSRVGHLVILVLIQLGGLGIMTFSSIIMMLIGKRISYQEKKILQEDLNQEKLGGIVTFIKRVVLIVFGIELIGAVIIFFTIFKKYSFSESLFYSVFHSISAFCNAGFALFPNSLELYRDNFAMNMVVAFLITIGGIGFAVINSFLIYLKTKRKVLNLTSRLALKISIWLLVIGTILIFLIERTNPGTIKGLNFFQQIQASFFQSVSTRTAGFNSIPMGNLMPATIFLFLVLMFIGASPGSTGGGVKTTTFGVIIFAVFSIIRNKKDIEIKNRRVSWHILNRAVAILVISLSYILIITLAILIREPITIGFDKILFEVVSAFGTVGLSMGITNSLTGFSKLLIIITMFIGRVGPLTFALALGENLKIAKHRYPRENISVG